MDMNEYYIIANSFAAPFMSDTSEGFVEAKTPKEALDYFAAQYSHPSGLYSAVCYKDANAKAKNNPPLATWLCNYEIKKQEITKNLGAYSFFGKGSEGFEINGKNYDVEDYKNGKVI